MRLCPETLAISTRQSTENEEVVYSLHMGRMERRAARKEHWR